MADDGRRVAYIEWTQGGEISPIIGPLEGDGAARRAVSGIHSAFRRYGLQPPMVVIAPLVSLADAKEWAFRKGLESFHPLALKEADQRGVS